MYNNDKTYKWKRYWLPYEENTDSSYFQYGEGSIKNAKTLEDLRDEQYLILLGEAALGKTTSLNQEEEALRGKSLVEKIDFKLLLGETAFFKRFDELRNSINKTSGSNSRLYLLLDSFDEGHSSFKNLVDLLLSQLIKLPIDKLYLRIACRSVVYPEYLEAELNKLINKEKSKPIKTINSKLEDEITIKPEKAYYPKNLVKIYNLLPLNKTDIDIVLDDKAIDKIEFNRKVETKKLECFLGYPITLKGLLANYPSSLEKTQYNIYKDSLLDLCKKLNKLSGILTPDERLYISSVIATLMTFTNKQYISYVLDKTNKDKENTLYLQDYVSSIEDLSDNKKLALLQGNIEEVLNTGLYTGSSDNIDFVQKTYKEFLTAYFLNKNNLYSNFANLLFDENNKIVSYFYNVIGWLAEQNQNVFDDVLNKDPESLIISNVSFSSDENNKKLINKLFYLLENELITTRFNIVLKTVSKFQYPSLETEIAPFLNNSNTNVIYLALMFIKDHKLIDLEEKVFNIAINTDIDPDCRNFALIILNELNKHTYLNQIKNHLSSFVSENNENQNRMYSMLLNVLFPNYIDIEQALDIISKVDNDKFFMNLDVGNLLINSPDFKRLYDWLIGFNCSNKGLHCWRLGELNKEFTEHLLRLNEIEYISKLILKRGLKDGEHHSLDDLIRSFLIKKEYIQTKHNIFKYIFKHLITVKDYEWVYAYCHYFDINDIGFLIKQILVVRGFKKKKFIYIIICKILGISFIVNFPTDIKLYLLEVGQIIKNKKITYHEWRMKALLKKIFPYRDKLQDVYYKIKAFMSRKRPIDFIRKNIDEFNQDSDYTHWQTIIYNLNLYKPYTDHNAILPADLTTLYGWERLNNKEKELIYRSAAAFLKNKDVAEEDKRSILISNSLPMLNFLSCFQALILLYRNKKDEFFQMISDEIIIKKWFIYVIKYPEFSNNDLQTFVAYKKLILTEFFNAHKDNCIKEIEFIIDTKLETDSSSQEIYYDFLNNLENINDSDLNKILLLKLEQNDSNNEFFFEALFRYIIEYLLKNNYSETVEYLKSNLNKSTENISIKLQAISAYFLLLYEKNCFGLFKYKLDNNEEFAKVFFESHGHNSFHFAENRTQDICTILTDDELAQFYIILEKTYPKSGDRLLNGFVSARDEITELRRNLENVFITSGRFKIFEYIKKNSEITVDSYWIQKAKRNFTELYYDYIKIENIFEIISGERKKIILNNRQLFDLILEKLDEIQKELRNDQGYLKLWNEVYIGNKPDKYFPKNERALSNELRRELQRKLSGVIINREVEILEPTIRGQGQRVDLKIECPTQDNNIATVIIEVKGCWNTSLKKSIKTQLYNGYLCDDNSYKYGIYLIGWYWCKDWNDEYQNKKRKPIKLENRFDEDSTTQIKEYFQNEAKNLSVNEKIVKAFILDVSIG